MGELRALIPPLQINGYEPGNVEGLRYLASFYPIEFILQVRSEERLPRAKIDADRFAEDLRDTDPESELRRSEVRASLLFDPSGGGGIETKRFPASPPGVKFGYAGGIGPTNVGDVLHSIEKVHALPHEDATRSIWIDMESGVRDEEDKFDLARVRSVLEQASVWIRR